VLTYVCTAQRRGLKYVLLVAVFEFFKGFAGFFADFKEIFLVLLVGVIAASPKLRPRTLVMAGVLAGTVLTLGAFWSAIKGDYRKYVSLGSWEQVVLVPLEDRLAYIWNRASEADVETMRSGFDTLVRRLSYVELLSATMRNVPARMPFEDGALIGATVMHVLQPRLLFPDKPPLPSDTQIAVRYSGIGFDVGGHAASTSISLGYVAELYVDFGLVGTVGAMFVVGFIFGRAVRYLAALIALPAIVSSGLSLMLMMSVMSFEQALPKMVGAFVTTFAVLLAVRSFFFPYLLANWGPSAAVRGSSKRGASSAGPRGGLVPAE
jgi:hypothetical protein